MAEFRAALLALAKLLTAFVDSGGVQVCVDLWRQRIVESISTDRRAELEAIDSDLASGVPARVERATVRLLDATDYRWSVGSRVDRPGERDGNGDVLSVSPDVETLESLRRESAELGLME